MKKYIIIVTILLLTSSVKAITYTAIKDGYFSNTTTWTGGAIPPTILNAGDTVNINGKFIWLDRSLTFNSQSILNASGRIQGLPGIYIKIHSAILISSLNTSGITIDSFVIGPQASISYSGSTTVKVLDIRGNTTINLDANKSIIVSETIRVTGGTLTISKGLLSFPIYGQVIIDGGNIRATSGGIVNNWSLGYKLIYKGATSVTGMEISREVHDVDINVAPQNEVILDSNLTCSDSSVLTIKSGTLNLNSHGVTVSNIKIPTSGNGAIKSSSSSFIHFRKNIKGTSEIRFTTDGDTVREFSYQPYFKKKHEVIKLLGDMNISTSLILYGKLDVQTHNLNMLPSSNPPNIPDFWEGYIITEHGGTLTMGILKGKDVTFQVGTDKHKAPFTILGSSTSIPQKLSVGVKSGVLKNATSGSLISATQPLVDATWQVTGNTNAGTNLNIELGWHTDIEVNQFLRHKGYITHYTGERWDWLPVATHTYNSKNNVSFMQRNNVNDYGYFTVFDKNTAADIEHISNKNNLVIIHPNPTRNELTISGKNIQSISVKNIAGATIYQQTVDANSITINTSKWASGMYIATISQNDEVITYKKIIKN